MSVADVAVVARAVVQLRGRILAGELLRVGEHEATHRRHRHCRSAAGVVVDIVLLALRLGARRARQRQHLPAALDLLVREAVPRVVAEQRGRGTRERKDVGARAVVQQVEFGALQAVDLAAARARPATAGRLRWPSTWSNERFSIISTTM